MKVSELIELLNKCKPDAAVKFDDMSYVEGDIDRSDITTVYEARCLDNNNSYVILTNENEGKEND